MTSTFLALVLITALPNGLVLKTASLFLVDSYLFHILNMLMATAPVWIRNLHPCLFSALTVINPQLATTTAALLTVHALQMGLATQAGLVMNNVFASNVILLPSLTAKVALTLKLSMAPVNKLWCTPVGMAFHPA
jgi:hypothetical protein